MSVSAPVASDAAHLQAWERDGFLVLRQFFNREKIQALIDETDRLLTERRDLVDPFNLRCRFMPHGSVGRTAAQGVHARSGDDDSGVLAVWLSISVIALIGSGISLFNESVLKQQGFSNGGTR